MTPARAGRPPVGVLDGHNDLPWTVRDLCRYDLGAVSLAGEAAVRSMHERGARYLTLTHNENVPWADSATDEPALGGLSDFGCDVVREMNRLGMLVDLSHVSDGVMHDALEVSAAPVVFSHSSARALASHPRNVPDEVLDVVSARGLDPRRFSDIDPVIEELSGSAPPAPSVSEAADHVEHVREVAGSDHVGLGGDYDGAAESPAGMEDVSGYPLMFEELRRRGWSEGELAQLGSGNVLRAMRDMESVAAEAVVSP